MQRTPERYTYLAASTCNSHRSSDLLRLDGGRGPAGSSPRPLFSPPDENRSAPASPFDDHDAKEDHNPPIVKSSPAGGSPVAPSGIVPEPKEAEPEPATTGPPPPPGALAPTIAKRTWTAVVATRSVTAPSSSNALAQGLPDDDPEAGSDVGDANDADQNHHPPFAFALPPSSPVPSFHELGPEYPALLIDLPDSGSLLSAVAALLRARVNDDELLRRTDSSSLPVASHSSDRQPEKEDLQPPQKRRRKARRIGARTRRRPSPGELPGPSPPGSVPAFPRAPLTHRWTPFSPAVTPPSTEEGPSRRVLGGKSRCVRFAAADAEEKGGVDFEEEAAAAAAASSGSGGNETAALAAATVPRPDGGRRTKTSAASSARALASALARRRTHL